MLKRNKELQELVKKYKEEEKKKKNTATPKAIAAPTSQDSNLVGGASINNTSIMENSRLKRNEAPKTKTNLLRSEAPKTSIFETFNSDGYANTGKKYGDYYYNNYSELKDVPIYKDKNGKYFTYYNNKYDLLGTGITGSTMTSKSEQKRQLEEAKKLGFKEQEREKTKEYKKAEKAFSKLQKEYNLTDDELNQYIKSGKLSYKGLKTNLITKSMTDARETANTYRQMLDKGSIKKYENNSLLTAEQRLDLATNNLTKSQKSEFKEDLIRQNKKANSGYNDKPKYGYDGTLSGTIKALGSTINNVGDTLNKNIVQPMNNMKDYYEYGKKQNDLAIEYYKKMENKKNNAEAKQKEMDLYQKFNQDLMTDKSWGAEALRNANTQVESLKRQGIVATASSIAGGLVGTAVNPGAGTLAGAKIGGSIGYTLGSTPYTYKLEAGNQYQALSEMGVPDKIAKKYSRVTGGINAAIESGENVVDLITWGVGTKGSNAVSKEAVNKLVKDYGKEQVEEWANKGASKVAKTAIKSYLQNIGSEALEETSQEATSILGERLATKESGIKRDVSLKEDLSRALEAGKSAAVSTALTAPISSIGGTLNTNMMNQIETKVNNKINNKTINNNNITTEETQINKQQDNIIDTPQEAKQEVRQEVIEDVQEQPNTQPTISESKINEIVENVTKNSKIEYNQKEIADLKKTLYDEVEKLGGKIEKSISNKLEERLSGDKLLNAQDLINEVKSVGAKVDDNGYITLYHQTTPESAQKIKETGKMISKERDIFFSTSKDAQQSNGRGNVKLEFKIPAENLILDDIFSDNADLKISLDGKNELDVSNYIVNNEIDNSLKQQQLDIIKRSNPMQDDYHAGIRTIEDIKTLEETLNDSDYEGYDTFNPDLTRQDIENAIKKGTITVYSSYPIENGVFVSPSKMEAESYSGNGKVYSKEVSINDVAWIDPTQGQYAKVNEKNFPTVHKNNIPINEKMYKKYQNAKEIFNGERNNYDGNVKIDSNISDIISDYNLENISEIKECAIKIFKTHNNKNIFVNDGKKIIVSDTGIRESIEKIFNNRKQRNLLNEHLKVFSDLGDIIEHSSLVNQTDNKKIDKHPDINIWNYYFDGLDIDGKKYSLEFEVRSMNSGENQYRVQRLEPKEKTGDYDGVASNNTRNLPPYSQPVSNDNDTTKTNKSQIAPSQNSMQQNEKNTPKEKNTIEERIPDVIEVRQSPMDKTSLNKLSKNMAKELYLNNSQITDLKDVIQDFYRRDFNEYSKKDLFNSIKDKFSEHNEKIIADDSLNDIQQQIRNTKIKVPEQIKEGIGDYNNLRQSNFGKTKLGNTGMELDSFYDELASDYPAYFDSELTGEDQLLRIIDVANMDNSYTETYKLDDNYIQDITDYIDESIKDYKNEELRKLADKEIKAKYREDKKTYALPKKITHKEVREQLLKEMKITPLELTSGKDIKNINFQLTDPIRVNEKVFGAEMGKLINEATIEKTKHNTAEKTRFLNKERNDIKELGIKARSKESAAVQKYAEKQYVNKYGETVPYGDKELMSEFKDTKTQEKIKKAASMLRNKYDRYIDEINDVITALGYDPIPKRKDYMKHFQELGDVFSQTGVPFNLNDMKAEDLPTDINGLTEFNKPGKNWFASAQQRYGNKTTYDAITGIDTYLEGAANLIYHTADIQRYRALSQLVRDTFGQKKGFENLDNLTNEEAQQRIKDIQNNKLSKYAAWLDEQANNLAGKKGAIDRGVERFLGRRVYTGLNTIKKQVGSNMTGFNVRSAMTNFISSTIASAKTNKLAFVKGTISTINNMFKNDGFINKSDFLTSRLLNSDMLSSKTWQKVSNAGQIFMTGSDWFTANQIVRSKYYEGLQKGMTEKQAIDYADDFASRVMGDRSQGMTAEAFNSKTLGLLTQFQLETNNQWQYMIHDSIMDYQRGSKINGGLKAGATILFQLGQLAAFSYLFNELFQKLTGSRAAFDPIDIFKKLFGTDDDDDDKKSWDKRLSEANAELVDSIPFGNIFTGGGRIPISEAFTGISTLNKKLTGQKNSYGGEITWDDVKDDMLGSLPYYVLPTGYGQAKKTAKGLSMFTNDKEIKGSYTKSGRLRFPVEDTPENKIQAALFGQYASENARKYVNEGHNTLTEKQQKELKTLDIPISEYWEIKSGLRDINNKLKGSDKTTDERKEIYYKYIDSLKISKDKKNILKKLQYKSYTDSDEDIIDYISSIKAKKSTKQALLERMGLDK